MMQSSIWGMSNAGLAILCAIAVLASCILFALLIATRRGRIAAEHLARLTERFYRVNVKESRGKGGTGLGLAIVKHILNRHRGRLLVRSELGEGSRFIVRLPYPST